MIKTSIATLATLIAVAGLAAPALASSVLSDNSDPKNFNEDIVLRQLEDRGLNVIGLYDWRDNIRADVQLADGSSQFLYFEAGSLKPIDPTGSGSNTRVLTKVDTGAITRPVVSTHSLISDYDDDN